MELLGSRRLFSLSPFAVRIIEHVTGFRKQDKSTQFSCSALLTAVGSLLKASRALHTVAALSWFSLISPRPATRSSRSLKSSARTHSPPCGGRTDSSRLVSPHRTTPRSRTSAPQSRSQNQKIAGYVSFLL